MKIFILTLCSTLLISCYSELYIAKPNRAVLSKGFKAKLNSKPEFVRSNRQQVNNSVFELFGLYGLNSDSVKIEIPDSNHLMLSYTSSLITDTITFEGNFKKNGAFQIQFAKQNIMIPIIYSRTNINKVRIGLTKDRKIWINKYFDNTGNIFLIAGGNIYNETFFFSY